MTACREGFALVVSMLLVMALAVMAMGVLAVGTREAAIAGAVVRRAQAERDAEGAALDIVRSWSTAAVTDLPVGSRQVVGEGRAADATIERIDAALYLVRGTGRVPGPHGPTTAVAGLLVRTPGTVDLAPAAITAAGAVTVTEGSVAGSTGCRAPGPGILAPEVAVATAATVTGTPPVETARPPPPPYPDAFDPPLVRRLADRVHTGPTAVPRPAVQADRCLPDRRNWGSPDPEHPCFDLLPVVYAPGDLTVVRGVGRVVLVVEGDLRVTGGAELVGILVVHGHLELDDGSRVRGSVRAGSVTIAGGTVIGDGCAVIAAARAPALDRAFRPRSRWWVPAF